MYPLYEHFIATNASCIFALSYQLSLGMVKQHLPANASLIRFRNSHIIFKNIRLCCLPRFSMQVASWKKRRKKTYQIIFLSKCEPFD